MASYIPWYGKKRERLAEHECTFRTLLQNDSNLKELREAADMVRLAHVRALKAKRAQLPPSEQSLAAIENLEREIQFWYVLTVDEVIQGYRTGTLPKHRVTAERGSAKKRV